MILALKVAMGWIALAAAVGVALGRVFAACGRRDAEPSDISGADLGNLPHPSTGSVVLTVERGRVIRLVDLGSANAREEIAGREIARTVEADQLRLCELLKLHTLEITRLLIVEGVPNGSFRDAHRTATRIVDSLSERIRGLS